MYVTYQHKFPGAFSVDLIKISVYKKLKFSRLINHSSVSDKYVAGAAQEENLFQSDPPV